MSSVDKLEAKLDGVFKKAPVKLPPEARKSVAGALWWVALIFGVLQLWAAYTLWSWGHKVDQVIDTLNSYSSYFGTAAASETHLGLFYYVSLVTMAIVGALLLLAAPQLKAMSKKGWNLVFYGILLEAAVAVFRLFSNVGGGFSDFLGSAIGAVLGAWLLFQVREHFVGVKAAHKAAAGTEDKPSDKPADNKK